MGVFLRADKVSHAMEKSKESPTRLLRILMDMFFEPEIMARSTAKGSQRRGLEALDQTIMEFGQFAWCLDNDYKSFKPEMSLSRVLSFSKVWLLPMLAIKAD